MNSMEATESILSLDEAVAPIQQTDGEKENKVNLKIIAGFSGKGTNENPIKIPWDLIALPPNTVSTSNKDKIGPLSPVQLNVRTNHVSKEKLLPKTSAVRSRQEMEQTNDHKPIESNIEVPCKTKKAEPNDSYVYDEGLSLMGEVAIFADAEEEEQLRKVMVNDQNTKATNKTILDQSKELVNFLGGSIKTALQHNSEIDIYHDNVVNDEAGRFPESADARTESEDPSIQRLNDFVGNLIGKLGSMNALPTNDSDLMQCSNNESENEKLRTAHEIDRPEIEQIDESALNTTINDEESPISQRKSKYWETLMLLSEDSKQLRYEYCESPSPSSLNDHQEKIPPSSMHDNSAQRNCEVDDVHTSTIIETPCIHKKALGNKGHENICETEPSPQSMISIPMDYSPGESVLDIKNSPRNEGRRSRKDNSPGSMMFNMISEATNLETPLICKTRLTVTDKNSNIEAFSFGSDMTSTSTAIKTPDLEKSSICQLTDKIPDESNSTNPAEKLTSPFEQITDSGSSQPKVREKCPSQTRETASSFDTDGLLGKTPIKSNKTEDVAPAHSDSSLYSDCDDSEDGSIYTSFSYQSSIQSNTPRSRRVTEWLDPSASNAITWPTPSMTTNVRTSETPERQLPAAMKLNESPLTMGTGQYLSLPKQIRTTSKSAQKSDWRLQQPLPIGRSTSPNSLPSLLGPASCNEVSDLESPNIINFPLNFKFSEEESTIHSQSAHESSDIHSAPSIVNQLHEGSPQSLMTEATPAPEPSRILCILGNKIRLGVNSPQSLMTVATPTVGYPTDEEFSHDSKSPKETINRKRGIPRADMYSLPTFTESNSPHSADKMDIFQNDIADDKILGYSKCLKRCIAFGMLVAFVGAITVLFTLFLSPSSLNRPANSDEELDPEIWSETSIPTSGTSLSDTTDFRTLDPSSISTSKPMAVSGLSPTQSPAVATNPTPTPSSKNSDHLLRPTTTKVNSTGKPTTNPTYNLVTVPTFSREEIKDLTWHRIVNGENIWRNADKTPLWFLAADTTPGIRLKVINAARDDRLSEILQMVVEDYSRSKAVSSFEVTTVPYEILCAPPEIGEIKVCSGDYGDAEWIGSTILFMRDDYIVSALIRINESSSSSASKALLQYELCHQLGHSLGVVHNVADLGLSSCMKDFGEDVVVTDDTIQTNQNLQHPNSDDLDFLVSLYGSYSSSRMLRQL